MKALIFDCDGVLVDTERDGHRVAFNRAFGIKNLSITWNVEVYGKLLQVAGGKERMVHFFNQFGWPQDIDDRDVFIKEMHALKTEQFMGIIESGELALRSGIMRIVDEAIEKGIRLAVCSTSNEKAVNTVVDVLFGKGRKSHFEQILAGDVVSHKKPDPEIYNLAKEKLSLSGEECVVVEDSRNGLLAAKGAGMHCIVTKSAYTGDEDFTEADCVVDALGDPPDARVSIADLNKLVTK